VLEQFDWQAIFAQSLTYEDFLQKHGTEAHQGRWANMAARVQLTAAQKDLVGGFVREMNVFCLSGAWCGDCVNQVPILQRIAEASPRITLRLLDREAIPQLRDALVINGGQRVPAVVFLSEDWQVCAIEGDRVVAYYRQMAQDRLGPACPTGVVPPGEGLIAEAVQEWVTRFERIQLMLRLTPRLRQQHDD
jgi:hypothetical protein